LIRVPSSSVVDIVCVSWSTRNNVHLPQIWQRLFVLHSSKANRALPTAGSEPVRSHKLLRLAAQHGDQFVDGQQMAALFR
jgi:hypothetical protein